MLVHPDIDPVAFSVGPVAVRWYGLMYLIGFVLGWLLGRRRANRPGSGWTLQQVDDLIFHAALGVILGGRVGYVLFYDCGAFLDNPLVLFKIWEGGMSFHGGVLGVLIALGWYARKLRRGFFEVTDFLVPLVPPGLFFGRIGNFINGELWGRISDAPWAMAFPAAGPLPRHPSQLYEAALEGIILFLVLWFYSAKPRPVMAVSGLFLLLYGVFRSAVEFFREPDAHLGFIAFDWLTMGQVLSVPMIFAGLGLLAWAYRRQEA